MIRKTALSNVHWITEDTHTGWRCELQANTVLMVILSQGAGIWSNSGQEPCSI